MPKPKRLWAVFWLSAALLVLGVSVASSAPEPIVTTLVPSPSLVETQVATPEEVSIKLLSLMSPVNPGEYFKLFIQTAPESDCHLSYKTPKGTNIEARGLGDCRTDKDGICSWRWFIGTETVPGIGMLTVEVDGIKEVFSIKINE